MSDQSRRYIRSRFTRIPGANRMEGNYKRNAETLKNPLYTRNDRERTRRFNIKHTCRCRIAK